MFSAYLAFWFVSVLAVSCPLCLCKLIRQCIPLAPNLRFPAFSILLASVANPCNSCCTWLTFFLLEQVSVYKVLKRQKHLRNLILANSCESSVAKKEIPVKIREDAYKFPHISQKQCGLRGSWGVLEINYMWGQGNRDIWSINGALPLNDHTLHLFTSHFLSRFIARTLPPVLGCDQVELGTWHRPRKQRGQGKGGQDPRF